MADAEIVQFKPTKVLLTESGNQDAIEMLEELLDLAKSGEVLEILCIAFRKGGGDSAHISPTMDTLRKIGAVRQLEFDLLCARTMK